MCEGGVGLWTLPLVVDHGLVSLLIQSCLFGGWFSLPIFKHGLGILKMLCECVHVKNHDDHLMSTRIFTLIMNKICMWAPKNLWGKSLLHRFGFAKICRCYLVLFHVLQLLPIRYTKNLMLYLRWNLCNIKLEVGPVLIWL